MITTAAEYEKYLS
jgi:hypothetical protein